MDDVLIASNVKIIQEGIEVFIEENYEMFDWVKEIIAAAKEHYPELFI